MHSSSFFAPFPACSINPDFADAWADLGCAHAALGDVIEAQRCLKEALDIDPDHIEAHFNLGNVLRQCHDMRAALAHYDAVLDLDPDHWRTLLNKAITLACLGNTARSREAVECLQRAVECSGHGGVLASEVEALKALMVGGANLDTLSQQASVIEDKARRAAIRAQNQAEGGGSSMISGSASMSASVSVSVSASQGGDGPGRGGGADLDTASSGALSRMNSGPAPAVGGGVAPGGIPRQYGVSPSKLVRTASNASSSPSKRGARERVAAWVS